MRKTQVYLHDIDTSFDADKSGWWETPNHGRNRQPKMEKESSCSFGVKQVDANTDNGICHLTFRDGPGACNNAKCQARHNLNFRKIKKGLCYREYLNEGSCRASGKVTVDFLMRYRWNAR